MTTTATRTRTGKRGSPPVPDRVDRAIEAAGAAPGMGPGKPTQGFRVIKWIEAHCVFTNGEWIGQPFVLQKWQKRLLLELFEIDPDTGWRRFRWAYISVPKKNGKTELAAALGLYFLIGDEEPAALIICAAAAEEQADLVFGAAKTMCEMSPTLRAVTQVYSDEITVPSSPGSRLKRVAAAAGTNDGRNIHVAILDELHEWVGEKGRKVWDVLTNGLGARRQPMIIQITTAGFDVETVCGEQYEYSMQVQRGEVEDPRHYSFVVEAPEGMDYRTEEYWRAANPSYGVTVHGPFFEDQARKKPESTFRRYFGNEWVESDEFFVPHDRLAEVHHRAVLNAREPIWVGVDFAHFHDAAAVVAAQRQEVRGKVRTVCVPRFWQNPFPAHDPRHERWVVPTAEVEEHLRALYRNYPAAAGKTEKGSRIAGPAYYCDPARFGQSMETLSGERLNIVKIAQSDQRMVPVAQTLNELLMTGELVFDTDTVDGAILLAHLKNASKEVRPRGGFRISRPKISKKRIDGAIAAGLAAHGAQQEPPKQARFYSF